MREKIVAGNWKMNGNRHQIQILLQELVRLLSELTTKTTCLIFPPSIYIGSIQEQLAGTKIKWGAQNVYPKDQGAFTGELSGPMLKDFGCNYVLVGHSERRQLFGEKEKFIADKFHHVKEHGMIPVLCVGETREERVQGLTKEILAKQLLIVRETDNHCFRDCVIAYEPIWAIGTGQTALPEQVQEVHSYLRALVAELNANDAKQLPILYGGSVNEKNAGSLFAMPDVDGGLVGGASLNAQQFVDIVKCIS